MDDATLLEGARWLVLGLAAATALVAGALAVLRVGRRILMAPRERARVAARGVVMEALLGEGDAAGSAAARIRRSRGARRRLFEDELIGMLPRIRGEAHDRALPLLTAVGAEKDAFRDARAFRAIRRCRGAYALGVLRVGEGRLRELLADPSFDVRRVAARALGQAGHAASAPALLELAASEPELARDAAYALGRLGEVAAPVLREVLAKMLVWSGEDVAEVDRVGALVATLLGDACDLEAAGVLADAAVAGPETTAAAAADSLGRLELPTTTTALLAALDRPESSVRRVAAEALGRLGARTAVEPLVAAVRAADPAYSREAATALVQLGAAGLAALRVEPSPYAREAVALADLGARP